VRDLTQKYLTWCQDMGDTKPPGDLLGDLLQACSMHCSIASSNMFHNRQQLLKKVNSHALRSYFLQVQEHHLAAQHAIR
jgi:hypothetical protein